MVVFTATGSGASRNDERTGHTNFKEDTEEKKPLTAEQKKEQLAKLQQKIAAKKKARVEETAQETPSLTDPNNKPVKVRLDRLWTEPWVTVY